MTTTVEKIEVTTEECCVCHAATVLVVDAAKFQAWQNGAMIQDAFPEMTDGEREVLKTGTHEDCWDVFLFPEIEEDEDY